jgi:type II secretory pathway pseudopilin PulG
MKNEECRMKNDRWRTALLTPDNIGTEEGYKLKWVPDLRMQKGARKKMDQLIMMESAKCGMRSSLPSLPSTPFPSRFTHHASRITHHAPRSTPHSRIAAFTLVELIGVLAVLAILGALATPAVIRQMDEAARTKEVSDLNAISNAIVLQVLTNKSIPSLANLPQSAAAWARVPINEVTNNRRRCGRAFLADTSGWFGTAAGSLPYTQTINGSPTAPVNARLMIISRIGGRALPATINFTDAWNTADRAVPSSWGSGWSGDDLVIQRLGLDPLFHRLVLVNRDPGTNGNYSIEPSTTVTTLPAGVTRSGYFLDGTDVTLMYPSGELQRRILLTCDGSCGFNGSQWADDYYGPGSQGDAADDFAYWAFRFMAAGRAPTAQQGKTPEGAVTAMYDFMLVFSLWANKCDGSGNHFPTYNQPAQTTSVPEYMLLDQIAGGGAKNNNSFMSDFTGQTGLLNPP